MTILANTSQLQNKAAYAATISSQLKAKVDDINKIYYNLDSEVQSRQGIGSSIYNIQRRIEKAQQKIYNISSFLSKAAEEYNTAESIVNARVAGVGAVNGKAQGASENKKWYQSNWVKFAVGAVVVGAAIAAAVTIGGPILVGMAVGAAIGAGVGAVTGGITSQKAGGSFVDGMADGFMWGAIGGAASGAVGGTGVGMLGGALAEGGVNSVIYAGQTLQNGGDVTMVGLATSFVTGAGFSLLGSVASNKISGVLSKNVSSNIDETVKNIDVIEPTGVTDINIKTENQVDINVNKAIKPKYTTKIDSQVTEIEKINLPDWMKPTFTDGEYRTVITNEKVTLYRTFGGKSDAGGAFATTIPAESRIQAKIDSALLPEWGGTRMYEAMIEVPEGQTLNIGKVAEQITKSNTKLVGGADQVLLPENWSLDWIKDIRIVPSI